MRTRTSSTKPDSLLTFHVADRGYAIPTKDVSEIVPMAELAQVPGSPEFLSGFLNVAGQFISVISLRRLFGQMDCDHCLYSPLVILKSPVRQIALEVDPGLQIVDVSGDDVMPLAENSSVNQCATAIVRLDGKSVVVLSVDRLLFEQERQRVAELAHLAGKRFEQLELVSI